MIANHSFGCMAHAQTNHEEEKQKTMAKVEVER